MNEKEYKEQIKQKDKLIEELKEKNEILLKTSIRSSKRLEEIKEKLAEYSKKFK